MGCSCKKNKVNEKIRVVDIPKETPSNDEEIYLNKGDKLELEVLLKETNVITKTLTNKI